MRSNQKAPGVFIPVNPQRTRAIEGFMTSSPSVVANNLDNAQALTTQGINPSPVYGSPFGQFDVAQTAQTAWRSPYGDLAANPGLFQTAGQFVRPTPPAVDPRIGLLSREPAPNYDVQPHAGFAPSNTLRIDQAMAQAAVPYQNTQPVQTSQSEPLGMSTALDAPSHGRNVPSPT